MTPGEKPAMLSLKSMLGVVNASIGSEKSDRVAARAASVRSMFKEAITHCYRDAAPAVLSHVNAVYILREGEGDQERKVLVVYMDDANFRSDVHERQYFIVLWLRERYGEVIEEFRTCSARGGMRQRHAYGAEGPATSTDDDDEVYLRPLSDVEQGFIVALGHDIEDPTLRRAFLKAARTSFARWL